MTARHAVEWRLAPNKAWFEARPLFQEGEAETSNLYLSWASAVMRVFGDGLMGARMLSVLPSLLCLPLVFVVARLMFTTPVALIAAFLLAISHWAAWTGRDGWDQVLMTALQLSTIACLLYALRAGTLLWSIVAGVVLGLCLFTYVASRLVFLQIAVWLLWEIVASPRRRRIAYQALLTLGIALLLAFPYFEYLATRSAGGFNVRVNELGIAGPQAWQTLLHNVIAHVLMFNVRGGTYARDNLPGWPMLDPVTGLLFLIGLVVAIRGSHRSGRLLITWYCVCVLGGILSVSREGPPYVYRVANLAPWACVIASVGAVAAWQRIRRTPLPSSSAIVASALVLALALAANVWILFVRSPNCPDIPPAFGTVETQVGLWLAQHPGARPCYVYYETLHSLDAHRGTLKYPETNSYNWYRPADSATCIQLCSGLYKESPKRALDPLAIRGDIDLVRRLPDHLSSPATFVVPQSLIEDVKRFYVISEQTEIRDSLGRNLALVVRVRSRV